MHTDQSSSAVAENGIWYSLNWNYPTPNDPCVSSNFNTIRKLVSNEDKTMDGVLCLAPSLFAAIHIVAQQFYDNFMELVLSLMLAKRSVITELPQVQTKAPGKSMRTPRISEAPKNRR